MELLSRFPHPPAIDRRCWLQMAGLSGIGWLTPLGNLLARLAEDAKGEPAQSVILLWLAGGPSQLETFDPHPGTEIAGGTNAIATAAKGVQLAEGFGNLAEQMESVALLRSLVSKEGDHERGTYFMKTGYRPDPTVVHPSIGAVCCHELTIGRTEIPRHISILPNQWPSRGGFLGDEYDAFKAGDPLQKVPDVTPHVPSSRFEQRMKDLDVIERAFAKGRKGRAEATGHRETVGRARTMMTSEQLQAFEVMREPAAVRKQYGENPFGRACLAARRLIEVGVRCVEVTLDGWDTHANNHALVQKNVAVLDPAFAALLADLKQRDQLRRTVVLCMGEFGRTPQINRLGGRDHWPDYFSVALAGGAIRGGQVLGATDPEGGKTLKDPILAPDLHATVFAALGINPAKERRSPIGRPLKIAEGKPIQAILAS